MAKSILIVGDFEGHTVLTSYALMRGYRVLYAEELESELPFSDQEDVRLVVVGNTNGHTDARDDQSLINLIKSDIPVILAGEGGLADIVMTAFQDYMTGVSRGSQVRKDISEAIELLLSGKQEEAAKSECLVFGQEEDFISLELNGDTNVQEIQGRIRKAIAFMEEHLGDSICLNDIAHAAFLSSPHFCRLFKEHTGFTCNEYLSILRVEKAKQMLRDTYMSVTRICFEVGFNSLTHFDRVFKSLGGISPSAYRQSCRSK